MRDRYSLRLTGGGRGEIALDQPFDIADTVYDWIFSHFPDDYHGDAVEVGAYDGFSGSQTIKLEERGWQVLSIEPNPEMEWFLKENRKLVWMGACSDHEGRDPFHIYNLSPPAFSSLRPTRSDDAYQASPSDWTEVEVAVATLDQVLDRHGFTRLDLASIDTEGTELDVLKGFDLDRWQPKLLIVESWEEQNPVVPYLSARGYRRVERRNVNDLFTRT